MRPITHVKFLYGIVTTFSIITIVWYILSAVIVLDIPPTVQMAVSFVISLFIFIDLIIMIRIWRTSGEFNSTKHIQKWPFLSVILYIVIIVVNLLQGLMSHGWFTSQDSIEHTTITLSAIATVATILNIFAIFQAKRQIKKRPKH